jgi:hypothetical protein
VEAVPPVTAAPPAQTNPISPDGKSQWNGTSWLPIRKKGHLVRNLGIVVGALILIGGIATIASPGANSPSGNTATSPAPSKSAASPAPSKAATSPTVNQQHQVVVAYSTAASNTGPIVDSFTAIGKDCGSDTAACRADLQSTISAITNYESALNKVQVPACLQQADRDLRLGMALIKQGAQQAINGIDASDASQINAGTALLDQGTRSITTATGEISSANCP